jgi:hypothetical protein
VVCLKDEKLADAATLSSEAQEMEENVEYGAAEVGESDDGEHNRKRLYERSSNWLHSHKVTRSLTTSLTTPTKTPTVSKEDNNAFS